MAISKRDLLISGVALSLLPAFPATAAKSMQVEPFPLESVTLTPSLWRRAVDRNAEYLLSLEPDRFLHNFRTSAGLAPKGDVYGGWEAMGIAGHSLGHYLSACSLMYAQIRDDRFRARVDYMVAELAVIQAAHGDGYVGGTTVERDGKIVDGKIVYEEVRAHKITTHGFDVNGGWVPLYTWHKVHAGLLDAHRYGGNAQALDVAVRMSDYLIGVLGGLSDDELQRVLAAEHGGLNETFTETYVRTGQKRFLDMGKRLYHKAILTPLAQGQDELAGKHANTQIPKLIGLARLYEVTGDRTYRDTAAFFWDTVVHRHSYVIGGNSDSEHFDVPGALNAHISDKTCEACNSYNMLKLTRHLYAWSPDAKWFDFYERAHLNHILAHQDPDSGLFVYFMPLYAGSERVYSTPTNSFWCCVGSGMESHSKHGDSIYWRGDDTLFVNLFIPSEVDWMQRKTKLRLTTDYPHGEDVTLTVTAVGPKDFTLALRLPAWCAAPRLRLNGTNAPILAKDGYVCLRRRWKAGDTVTLSLPQTITVETIPDNPRMLAFVKGPMVLAADLGPAGGATPPRAPVLIGSDPVSLIDKTSLTIKAQPQPVPLKPFFAQYRARSAVYFSQFTPEQWQVEQAAYLAAEQERLALDARTLDVVRLGEMQPERDHGFSTDLAEVTSRAGRAGRWLMWTPSNSFAFDVAVDPAGSELQVTYWGQDTYKHFDIEIDGQVLAHETLAVAPTSAFRNITYPLNAGLIGGKTRVRVRFATHNSDLAVFECRSLRPAAKT